MIPNTSSPEGILLVDKPQGKTSFYLVSRLRKLTSVKKIGHAGTLDPMATGVMVMLIGKNFTRKSAEFLSQDKEYEATITLGSSTDSFDAEGKILQTSSLVPTKEEVTTILQAFQGEIEQIPPMFSAKKVNGKKLCDLARKGVEVARAPVRVRVAIFLKSYEYPLLKIKVSCSKGTYIRTLAHDIGVKLQCLGHLTELKRTRSGSFSIEDCLPLSCIEEDPSLLHCHLKK